MLSHQANNVMCNTQCPISNAQCPTLNNQLPIINILLPIINIQYPTPNDEGINLDIENSIFIIGYSLEINNITHAFNFTTPACYRTSQPLLHNALNTTQPHAFDAVLGRKVGIEYFG